MKKVNIHIPLFISVLELMKKTEDQGSELHSYAVEQLDLVAKVLPVDKFVRVMLQARLPGDAHSSLLTAIRAAMRTPA